VRPATQSIRTRDAGIASIRYENGLFHTAAILDEALYVERPGAATSANGSISFFEDGGWTLQGSLRGARYSEPLPVAWFLKPWFRSARGESSLALNASAQKGLQPTVQLIGTLRTHITDADRGGWFGGSLSRSFDGDFWGTAVIGETGAWLRRGSAVVTATVRPMQLQFGDALGDGEIEASWVRGQTSYALTTGVRLGEAQRGTTAWVSLSANFTALGRYNTTASIGSYPADLLLGLPGGRYLSLSVRLPTARRTPQRPPAELPPETMRGRVPPPDSAPDSELALAIDSVAAADGQRMVRVRVPNEGTTSVELMGDFTEWEPVALLRDATTGEWVARLRIASGSHRLNVRIDGGAWQVPSNVARVTDEFSGVVGVVIVP
jgi:hypothetical protein